jgi:SPP1 family predicted phage head-tail adaptor
MTLRITDPGQLRLRVALERPPTELDERGQLTGDWTTYAHARAKIEPLRGSEQIDGHQPWAQQVLRVRIRWRPDVKSSHRITVNGRRLEILHVQDEEERRQWLILTCGEEV